MKYNHDLILPIENIDGDERSIMDGLMQDFVKTMVELGKAINQDKKWGSDIVYNERGKDDPVYEIRKYGAMVVFYAAVYGKYDCQIIITRNKNDNYSMGIQNAHWVNGFSAIAAAFAKLYRKHYAEIHNA